MSFRDDPTGVGLLESQRLSAVLDLPASTDDERVPASDSRGGVAPLDREAVHADLDFLRRNLPEAVLKHRLVRLGEAGPHGPIQPDILRLDRLFVCPDHSPDGGVVCLCHAWRRCRWWPRF